MRLPIPHLEPVAIAIDRLDVIGDARFSGIDLDSGARVTVSIDRSADPSTGAPGSLDRSGLVLVLTLQTMREHS